MDTDINILISTPGEHHEDHSLKYFVSLDNLHSKILNIFELNYEYIYLCVLIPNKSIFLNTTEDSNIEISIYDFNFENIKQKIISIYNKKNLCKNI